MSANDRQEGGDHYKTDGKKPQHWDLAVMYGWDPFQYQITKYVMRWKDKFPTFAQRLVDLKKARHFLDKYIEEAEAYDTHRVAPVPLKPEPLPPVDTGSELSVQKQGIDVTGEMTDGFEVPLAYENLDFQCEGFYGDGTELYRCRHCRTLMRVAGLRAAHLMHGACPVGRGYVLQG